MFCYIQIRNVEEFQWGVEHSNQSMFKSSNLGVFGIGDEHYTKNFINKKTYVKVVQVVGF